MKRLPSLACAIGLAAVSIPGGAHGEPGWLVRNAETGAFDFETTVMSGSIVTEGPYHGITRLVDKRSGNVVNDPRYSLLNLFKLMAVNLGMGTPRLMESEVTATDTAVEISWPATEAHQGEITARYIVSAPDTIDLHLSLRAKGTYAGYELLLPNYFDQSMVPHVFLLSRQRGGAEPQADLVVPGYSEVYAGCSLVFPRDAHAARRPLDGRWNRSEFGADVAPFFPVRHYAHPVAFLTNPEKTHAAVLMMKRAECSAISARYHSENPENRATSYSAVDFLIFGDDLVPGETRSARVRLVLTPLDQAMSQPLDRYREFLEDSAEVPTPKP